MFAPHIPPPSHSIAAHQAWQRIKIMFVCTVLGLFAGAASAAAMVAWLFPAAAGTIPVFLSYHSNDPSAVPLDQAVADEIRSKIVSVYSAVQKAKGIEYFDPHDFVGESLPVSSDGWMLMSVTSSPATGTIWYVVGQNGAHATTSQFVFDPLRHVLFLKIPRGVMGGNGRPLGFGAEPSVGDHAYRFSRSRIQPVTIERFLSDKEFELTSEVLPRLRVNVVPDELGFVADREGRLVGFETLEGLVPISYLEDILPSVFSGRAIERVSLGVSGWFAEQSPVFFASRRVSGFVVTKTIAKNSFLRKGDVIESIEGNIVTMDAPWYTVTSTSTVQASIIRDGKEEAVEIPLFPLGF